MKLLAFRRLLRIQRVVIRYRLDDLILELPMLPGGCACSVPPCPGAGCRGASWN